MNITHDNPYNTALPGTAGSVSFLLSFDEAIK